MNRLILPLSQLPYGRDYPVLHAIRIRRTSNMVMDTSLTKPLLFYCWAMVRACVKDKGIGLAAPQLGIFQRMFLIREGNDFEFYFNPSYTITEDSIISTMREGCLSAPRRSVEVARANTILANWVYFNSKEGKVENHTEIFTGMKARVFQHEFDHLEGKSILDF